MKMKIKSCPTCGKQKYINTSRTPLKVQSVRLHKDKYTLKQAKSWMKKHGYKYGKVDSKGNYYKFRQLDPKDFNIFRTKNISSGIQFIFAGNK